METLFLLLGSNLGDRVSYLSEARTQLAAVFGKTAAASNLYQTAAWGLQDQPAFLNQVLIFQIDIPPQEILDVTQQVEKNIGRIRKERWGARVIDVDILFYGPHVLTTPTLQIPHPQLHLRKFTLVPLAEVAPTFIHPGLHQTISQLLENCPDALEVELWRG